MSVMLYFIIAIRSTPIPAAIPVGILIFAARKVGRLNNPAPSNSIQPVCLQRLQPLPPQNGQEQSTSNDGSVKGKFDNR